MSQRLDETSRSIPHMTERHNVCAKIQPTNESSTGSQVSMMTIPMGYALVQVRVKDPSLRGKLCPTQLEYGECLKKDSCCDYSHSLDEVRSYNQHYRTKMCEFASNGFCKKGKACRFAHSVEELGTFRRCHSDTTITSQSVPSSLSMDRDSSMLSTEPPTPLNSTGESADFSMCRIPQIPLHQAPNNENDAQRVSNVRVCYKAPREQRTLSPPPSSAHPRVRRQRYTDERMVYMHRPVMIPSSYQYVENLKYIVPNPNEMMNQAWPTTTGPFVMASNPIHMNGGNGGYPPGMFYSMPIMYSTRSDSRPTSFALCPQQYID